MREFQRMIVRPRSTHTVTEFGGLLHNEEAPLGRWFDERNLSADGAPGMTVRRGRGILEDLDGNQPENPIIAFCGGEHLVLLDAAGNLYCNGHVAEGVMGRTDWDCSVRAIPSNPGSTFAVTVDSTTATAGYVGNMFGFKTQSITLVYDGYRHWLAEQELEIVDPYNDFGITVTGDLHQNDEIRISLWPVPYDWNDGPHTLVPMGAYVVIHPEMIAVNVVDLAAGVAVEAEDSYANWRVTSLDRVTLTPCLLDGTPINAVVSDTEPTVRAGYWMDTSGGTTVVRQWSVSVSSWVGLQGVYVKVASDGFVTPGNMVRGYDPLRQWDGVQISIADDFPGNGLTDRQKAEVKALLNSSHVLYGADWNSDSAEKSVIIAGIVSTDSHLDLPGGALDLHIVRRAPEMDFVVECGNRLWGCRYGQNEDGGVLNEIYASKLGDFRNWSCYMGLSTDSWTASRGTAAPFTGAAVLGGNPLFFREESLEKVYPSSAGAHQVQTFALEGVEAGSADSLVVIEERLYYKSRQGICVYAGTLPQRISAAFGALRFTDGSAARHGRKYCISMTVVPVAEEGPQGYTAPAGGDRVCAVYDIATGEWHPEDEAWTGKAVTYEDRLLYQDQYGRLIVMDGADDCTGVSWYAESGVIGYELPEHRFISCLRLRFRLEAGAACRVYLMYDDSGSWHQKGSLSGTVIGTRELNVFPRRCDHFRIRLEGTGGCKLLSISYRMESSEGRH